MTAEELAGIAGMVLSLVFSYVPGLRQRYGALDGNRKRLVMLVALAVTALGVYGLACTGLGPDFGLAVTCDRQGAVALVQAFVMALVANQATYALTPRGEMG